MNQQLPFDYSPVRSLERLTCKERQDGGRERERGRRAGGVGKYFLKSSNWNCILTAHWTVSCGSQEPGSRRFWIANVIFIFPPFFLGDSGKLPPDMFFCSSQFFQVERFIIAVPVVIKVEIELQCEQSWFSCQRNGIQLVPDEREWTSAAGNQQVVYWERSFSPLIIL